MSSSDFTEYMAYNQISPGGLERFDILTAMICCTVANLLKDKGRTFEIKDFKIDWGADSVERKPVGWKMIKTKLKAWADRHNENLQKEKE